MPIANASEVRLAYVAEATEGVTPATPSFKTLRYSEESIIPDKQTIVSDEIRSDRNVSDIVAVGMTAKGSVSGELSYATYDDLFEALLCGTWTTNVLKNGIVDRSFTFEKAMELGATDSLLRAKGVRISDAEISLTAKAIAKIKFDLMGMTFDPPATAIIAGATYAAVNTEPVLNVATHIGALAMAGVAATPKIKSATINIKNNVRGQEAIGYSGYVGMGLGRFEVTGKLNCYFENGDLLAAAISHTDLTLSLTIGAATNKKYTILIPKIKLTDPNVNVGGNNQDVMAEVGFQAIFDSTEAASIKITRAVA